MVRPRIIETDRGIQGEFTVAAYDQMQRALRDKGWVETPELLKLGITQGRALELGPGPGYLGLEWLKQTQATTLEGLDISPDMIAQVQRNTQTYGLADRATYVLSDGSRMPFEEGRFDAVFTNGSLHEWANPRGTFDEIWRVLKPGGRVFISDLRRDMIAPIKWLLWLNTQPRAMRAGLISSINAAYTPDELRALIVGSSLERGRVSSNLLGLTLTAIK